MTNGKQTIDTIVVPAKAEIQDIDDLEQIVLFFKKLRFHVI